MKDTWFHTGAAAVSQVWPDITYAYRCPLCGDLFGEGAMDQLSLEDAPPKSVGGSPIALTCRRCNNTAGSTIDASIASLHNIEEWASGRGSSLRMMVTLDDMSMTADVVHDGAEFAMFGVPEHSDPRSIEAIERALADCAARGVPPPDIRLSYRPRHRFAPPAVGWLKAAYVVAFAALGYRFAFNTRLRPVREQISAPSKQLLSSYHITSDAPSTSRAVLLVLEPQRLASVMVVMGSHSVLLPSVVSDNDLYAELNEDRLLHGDGFSHELRGKLIPWPESPQHYLDF